MPSKFLRKYFHVTLAISAYYLVQLKRSTYIHGKTFTVATPKNGEKRESLAQHIFPHLQYSIANYSRWKNFVVVELNCNSLKNIHGSMTAQ